MEKIVKILQEIIDSNYSDKLDYIKDLREKENSRICVIYEHNIAEYSQNIIFFEEIIESVGKRKKYLFHCSIPSIRFHDIESKYDLIDFILEEIKKEFKKNYEKNKEILIKSDKGLIGLQKNDDALIGETDKKVVLKHWEIIDLD